MELTPDPHLKVLGSYRATGNYVVEAASPHLIREELIHLTGGKWAVVDRGLDAFQVWSEPATETDVRWTPGLAFAVEPATVPDALSPTKRGHFKRVNNRVVAVYKRDILVSGRTVLDPRKRQGGWGGISAHVAQQAGGTWTSRSRLVIDALLKLATAI